MNFRHMTLALQEIVGEGLERTVWLHPRSHDRVVKVRKPTARFDRNRADWDWFQNRRAVACKHIPEHFGFEQTDRGPGLVCEFIRDEDGQPSKSVKVCLGSGEVGVEEMRRHLIEMYDWLIAHKIPICDSNLGNVLYQRGSKTRLVIVDGFGFSHGPFWWAVKKFRPLITFNNRRKRRRVLGKLNKLAAGS